MRKLNLKALRTNLGKELANLPIEVLKNGKTVAYIVKSLDDLNKSKLIIGAPMFCPIHNRMKTGDTYQCGCQVIG